MTCATGSVAGRRVCALSATPSSPEGRPARGRGPAEVGRDRLLTCRLQRYQPPRVRVPPPDRVHADRIPKVARLAGLSVPPVGVFRERSSRSPISPLG